MFVFVTLSTQENVKLLKQLKSGFQGAINWNKYDPEKSNQVQNRYLNVLIDPSIQGVNGLFLSFEGDDGWKSYKKFYLRTVEIKEYNGIIDGRNFFSHPIKIDWKTSKNFRILEMVKVMIIQLDIYCIIRISKNTINLL